MPACSAVYLLHKCYLLIVRSISFSPPHYVYIMVNASNSVMETDYLFLVLVHKEIGSQSFAVAAQSECYSLPSVFRSQTTKTFF